VAFSTGQNGMAAGFCKQGTRESKAGARGEGPRERETNRLATEREALRGAAS